MLFCKPAERCDSDSLKLGVRSFLASVLVHVDLAEMLTEYAFQFAVLLLGWANIIPRSKEHVLARGATAFDWYSADFHEDDEMRFFLDGVHSAN